METAAILRSFHGVMGANIHAQSWVTKSAIFPQYNASVNKSMNPKVLMLDGRLITSKWNRKGSFTPYLKASETTIAGTSGADTSEKTSKQPLEKKNMWKTFPNVFEKLVHEVCDDTEVAELKLKVGDFEMHLKRNMGPAKALTPIVSPTTAPPIPSEPMVESASGVPVVVPQKSSPVPTNPFANVSSARASKLAALDASGSSAYVLVSSPTVGSFRSGRTVKGKKQPPSCKEGDVIKEGQTIGFLDQFGNELPVKSDVAGEVLKVLFKDGEAVGYGDPLVAVLPSFHGINK